ncbi:MAG: hypothetical protein HKN25_06325 [Pyrinomonadaceae bacterium]|nr:hypothetical protein [Pyrinomonadaceae bacterium]
MKKLMRSFGATKTNLLALAMTLFFLAGAAQGVDRRIDMAGSTATIPKGNTVTRSLYRIPANTAGQIRLRLKWHAVNPVPYFNRLTIRLKHGNRTLLTRRCFSYHSNKRPRCAYNFTVTQAEANRSGTWRIEATNNSGLEVIGFDVEKGADPIPLVPRFTSVFRYTPAAPACSESTKTLNMQGSTVTIPKGNTVTRNLYRVGKSKGIILLRAKWHAVNPVLYFNRLSVRLIKPNGQTARTKNAFSYHNNQGKTKMVMRYDVTDADANLTGTWKIRITNNSGLEVIGFDIEKGSDPIPLVPNFKSTYRNRC